MTNGIVLVSRRGVQKVAAFRMQCDAKDIPDPIDGGECEYFVGVARATGVAMIAAADGTLGGHAETDAVGAVAIAVDARRLYAIVCPPSNAEPAAWVASDLGEFEIKPVGSEGLFKKRPHSLHLSTPEWTLDIGEVSLLFRKSGRYQTGKSDVLLSALTK